MADFITASVAAIATVGAAIGGPAITGALQNRREARLRRSIGDNLELVGRLRDGPEAVRPIATNLEELIRNQVLGLIDREMKELRKRRDWSSLAVVVFLLTVLGWVPIWLWSLHYWWSQVLAVFFGILLATIITAGMFAVFSPSEGRKTRAERRAEGKAVSLKAN